MSFGKRPLVVDNAATDDVQGLISAISNRYTVARGVAERAVDLVYRQAGPHGRGPPDRRSPGSTAADFFRFDELVREVSERAPRGRGPRARRPSGPGTTGPPTARCSRLVARAPGARVPPIGGSDILRAEVVHAARSEMVCQLSDAVFGRTGIATVGDPGTCGAGRVRRPRRARSSGGMRAAASASSVTCASGSRSAAAVIAHLGRDLDSPDRPRRRHRAQAVHAAPVPLLDRARLARSASARSCASQEDGRTVYGVVTDGFAYSDLETPMHAVHRRRRRSRGRGRRAHRRAEIRLYTAAVLRQIPEEPLQPVPLGSVWLAADADVLLALRMDAYTDGRAPDAASRSASTPPGGLESPVYLDCDFLLGPEAAHLNITGVSGLATKTSAVEFLLASIFQTFPRHKGSVGRALLQREGPRPLLPRPARRRSRDEDRRLYAAAGPRPRAVPPTCTTTRRYKADGVNLNTLRTNEALAANTEPLVWGLREVLDYAEVVLNRDDVDAKADAFIDFLAERVVGPRIPGRHAARSAVPGAELRRPRGVLPRHLRFHGGAGQGRRGLEDPPRRHDPEGAQPAQQHLHPLEGSGHRRRRRERPALGAASPTAACYVVDVAGLDPLAQDLVFARIVSKLREHLERRDLGVDHVVVFVDELNKYAPADGPETYVRKMLLDLSERGRYLGLVLFSAQQFRSQVQRRVVGNAGTGVYGRMDADELATPGYATLSPGDQDQARHAAEGRADGAAPALHPADLREVPPARRSSAGARAIERFPPAAELPFADAVVASAAVARPPRLRRGGARR